MTINIEIGKYYIDQLGQTWLCIKIHHALIPPEELSYITLSRFPGGREMKNVTFDALNNHYSETQPS